MNAIMDQEILKKYLAGQANDQEIQQCESYLAQNENGFEVDRDEEAISDSLLDTLRTLRDEPTISISDGLVEKIQGMVPRQAIGQDDLDRILSPPESENELGRIGRYRVIEFIASGGMGLVFKAEDPQLGRPVCIKVLHPMLGTNPESKARFDRESRAASRLRHDRIVTVLDVGEHRDLPFLVMELLDGQSLRHLLNEKAPLNAGLAKKISIQIAEGLRYAHAFGFLHRDIKPENIWITPDLNVKLLDFGLARVMNETTNLTKTGTIIGTPSYMSPEQVQGGEVDQRSDLFSLGSVIFEMLTGESPFSKSNLFSTMMSIANDSLTLPEQGDQNQFPVQIVPVVKGLLQKDVEQRTETAQLLIEQLESIDVTSEKPQPLAGGGRSRTVLAVICGLAGAVLMALGMIAYQFNDRGTLVVQADPSVEVSIKNEQVTIVDPVTGKKFTVRIGATPLPSGVYRLEMTDPSGQYSLSSEEIIIRRGKDEIVSVRLKPSSPANNEPGKSVAGNSDTSTAGLISLQDIPACTALELRKGFRVKDGPIAKASHVRKPTKQEGVTSWSVEPAYGPNDKMKLNSDGTLVASTDDFVRIWNLKGELLHLLPVQSGYATVVWSPAANVLATLERSEPSQVVVWRLTDKHAEVIRIIPGRASDVAWSWDGLKLALTTTESVLFHNLAEDKTTILPNTGPRGAITDRPWSHDSKLFAIENQNVVTVWNLEKLEVHQQFPQSNSASFLPGRNSVAIKNDSGDVWEVWDLDTNEREGSWRSMYRGYPDFQFKNYVNLRDDQIVVESVDGEESVTIEGQKAFELSKNKNGETKLDDFHWSADGTTFAFSAGLSDMFIGKLEDPTDLSKPSNVSKFGGVGSQRINPEAVTTGGGRVVFLHSEESFQGPHRPISFDLSSSEYLPQMDTSGYWQHSSLSVSPDGKWLAAATRKVGEKGEGLAAAKAFKVFSLDTGKLAFESKTEGVVSHLLWAPDSRTISITQNIKSGEKVFCRVTKLLDWESKTLIELGLAEDLEFPSAVFNDDSNLAFGLSSEVFPKFENEKLVIPMKIRKERQRLSNSALVCFDSKDGQRSDLIELPEGHLIFGFNPNLIVLERRSSWSLMIRKDKSLIPFEVEGRRRPRVQYPSPRRVRVAEKHDLIAIDEQSGRSVFSYDAEKKVIHEVEKLTSPNHYSFRFHPTQASFSYTQRKGVSFYEVAKGRETGSTKVRNSYSAAISSVGENWLLSESSQMVLFDGNGQVLQTYLPVAKQDSDSMKKETNKGEVSWLNPEPVHMEQTISADGSYLYNRDSKKNLRVIQLRDNRFETLTIEEFESKE